MNDFQEYFVHEFVAEYKQGLMSRRDMMRRVLFISGGIASCASLLTLLGCGTAAPAGSSPAGGSSVTPPGGPPTPAVTTASAKPASSPASLPVSSSAATKPSSAAPAAPTGARSPISVPADDPAVEAQDLTFQGNGATLIAYQARPKGAAAALPLVLVVHENRGLTDHIKDVTRRFAKEGYAAVAVDLLSREGGTASVTDQARIPAMLSAVDPARHAADFKAAADYLAKQPGIKPEAIAINGYCFGGGIVWRALEIIPTLRAGAPFYGPPPPLDAVKGIKAAVWGVYSSDPNDFANANRDRLEVALKAANVTYQFKVYPNTRHAFNNDTGPSYNQEQALAAWKDMLSWFAKYLKG